MRDLFESLLSVRAGLKDQRRAFDRQLARFAREDEACRIVSSAPGIGVLTAIAFVTSVDDPARFRTACDVGAYLGLTPRRYQSGEVDIGGRIFINCVEAVGAEFKRRVRELESASGFGPEIGRNSPDDVEDQNYVPRPELCRITI